MYIINYVYYKIDLDVLFFIIIIPEKHKERENELYYVKQVPL